MVLSRANEFLKAPLTHHSERVSEEDIGVSLLDEVEGGLGTGSATSRLGQMEAILRPIVAALPKNQFGKMGHSAVRYALHRLFVLRHGWVLKDLNAKNGVLNVSSPAGILTDQVPSYIEGLFEKRLSGQGFGLHELAVLAATIEHLIHNEAVSKLGTAFNVHKLLVTSPVSESEAREVLDTYMMAYILGENLKNLTLDAARELNAQMPEIFLAWRDTQEFVNTVQKNVTKGGVPSDFAALAKVVEGVGEQYGTFQDLECQQMKEKLVKIEYRGTGRVKLSDFYKPALGGSWQFQESAGYLRQLGLLDESVPNQPSVMIANYITSQANCIASSGFYSVCCKDECENLLSHLEQNIGAFEAKPATIAALISALPSSTVAVPQKLSITLLQRLEEIAAGHSGMVPLHSRLFAQWMHHVYPRECSFPHMSGTTSAKTPEEWVDETGSEATASEEEMQQHIQAASNTERRTEKENESNMAVEELMPWSSEEELFIIRTIPELPNTFEFVSSAPATMRSMMLVVAAGSLAFTLIEIVKKASPLGMGEADKKFAV